MNENLYDVIIVGGGPSGLTSAIYLARARYRVLLVEKDTFGGQIRITSEVVNYPGVLKSSGSELTSTMKKQAENFGAEFLNAEVTSLDLNGDIKTIYTSRGEYQAYGVILAMGAHPRNIGFTNEKEFQGRGVAYCATCDGEFFTGKEVFVVGGGFAAAEESVFLTKYAKHVTVLVREEDFTCAKEVSEHTKTNPNITVLYNTNVVKVDGKGSVNEITYKNSKTGEVTEYKSNDKIGVFVFAGYVPATSTIKDVIELDQSGYIITNKFQKTNIDGVYGAGDICQKKLRQVVTSVGDGAIAATELEEYCHKMHKKTGIVPEMKIAKKETSLIAKESDHDSLFSSEIIQQLNDIFSKFESKLELRMSLNETEKSRELKEYLTKLASLTDKLELVRDDMEEEFLPCVKIYKENKYTGLAFHGVPGGHEFTSFILGLYNASGPGQSVASEIVEKIKTIDKKVNLKLFVTLSCNICPDVVVSAQKVASLNDLITAEVYDISLYKEIKNKYNISSVPCVVINDEKVHFGKKDINALLSLI